MLGPALRALRTASLEEEGMKAKLIDWKFNILALNPCKNDFHSSEDSFLFLAKDRAVPAALQAYREECERLGCGPEHLEAIDLLYDRVIEFQELRGSKIPDTETPCEIDRCIGGNLD